MVLDFYKYQGTGNDFVLIDNRGKKYNVLTQEQISMLCHRKFGIGADGLIMLENSNNYDFAMKYFNSDGLESTMCGNGGRCITIFAKHLGIIIDSTVFEAIDGIHKATILSDNNVCLEMTDCTMPKQISENKYFINTGSPHIVIYTEKIDEIDLIKEGKEIRLFENANVNFSEIENGKVKIRTYERGVEDETLSCGTGSIAAAIISAIYNYLPFKNEIEVLTRGGNLKVSFDIQLTNIKKIQLIGQTKKIFCGKIEINDTDLIK